MTEMRHMRFHVHNRKLFCMCFYCLGTLGVSGFSFAVPVSVRSLFGPREKRSIIRVGQGFWVFGIQERFKSGIRYIAA